MSDFVNFLQVNGLKKKDIAMYLGVSSSFITQICSGQRGLPYEKFALIKANQDWNTAMLKWGTPELDLFALQGREKELSSEQVRSAVESVLKPSENNGLVDYLKQKVEDQDALIRELYQQIGMLEAKLELARKGETASAVGGSLSADAV